MPLLLPRSAWTQWLDPSLHDVSELLVPPSPALVADLELRPVASTVNNVRNNGPELVEPVPDEELPPMPERVSLDREHGKPG
jgi:putative SOS response-associated peptidase YedK